MTWLESIQDNIIDSSEIRIHLLKTANQMGREWLPNLWRRGILANAPNAKIYFKHSSPLALAANVW